MPQLRGGSRLTQGCWRRPPGGSFARHGRLPVQLTLVGSASGACPTHYSLQSQLTLQLTASSPAPAYTPAYSPAPASSPASTPAYLVGTQSQMPLARAVNYLLSFPPRLLPEPTCRAPTTPSFDSGAATEEDSQLLKEIPVANAQKLLRRNSLSTNLEGSWPESAKTWNPSGSTGFCSAANRTRGREEKPGAKWPPFKLSA